MFKSKMKRICALLFVMLVAVSVGCSKDPEPTPEPGDTQELSITPAAVTLIMGEQKQLVPTYVAQEGLTLQYESSDTAIATVDELGKITAIRVGSAVITATYGELKATCNVEVTTNGLIPKIELDQITGDTKVSLADTLNFSSKVFFNQKYFVDATVTYKLSDESIGSISAEGIFTPLKTGTTNVTVTAAWRGLTNDELSITVSVRVLDKAEISVNKNVFTLYSRATLEGKSFETSDTILATIKINDQEVTPVYTIVSGDDIIALDGNTITAIKAGRAEIEVSHTTASNDKYDETIAVIVKRPFVDKDYHINFDLQTGKLAGKDLQALFEDSSTVIAEVEEASDSLAATVNNGLISFTKNGEALKHTGSVYRVRIFNDLYGYECDLVAYDKVINTAEDLLLAFNQKIYDTANDIQITSGYILLNDNIDATGITVARGTGTDTRFMGGTLDGDGYAISNLTIKGSGLLGAVYGKTVIKDIALTGLTFSGQAAAFAGSVSSATTLDIDNVYVQVSSVSPTSESGALLVSSAVSTITYKNIIVEYPDIALTDGRAGGTLAGGLMNTTADMFENVYVISATQKLGGRIVKSDTPSAKRYAHYAENEANPPVDDYIKIVQGVYRYDNLIDMDSTKDYSTFNDCWDINAFGVPVWKTKITDDNYTPKIELLEITGNNAQIQPDQTLDFASRVVVDNIYFYDAEVSYTLSDESVGSVSAEGVFTPLKTGTTDVTVTAVWRGNTNDELSVTVTVQVLDDAEISAPSSLTLYTADEVDGQSFAKSDTIMATIKINGQVVTPVLTILSGEDVISLDGNVVTALTAGEAVIEVSYTTANNDKYAETIAVTVKKPFVDKDYHINFDLQTGKLADKDLQALFDDSGTVIAEVEEATNSLAAIVNNGAISFTKNGETLGYTGSVYRVRIFNDSYGYECDLVAYDKVINTAEDLLLAFNQQINDTDNEMQITSGYILLNDNIDATGQTVEHGTDTNRRFQGGTLDGDGYTISNLTIKGGGLLGGVYGNTVVKDIAMTGLSFSGQAAAFAGSVSSATTLDIDNVYVQVSSVSPTSESGALLVSSAVATITYKNIIVEYPDIALTDGRSGGTLAGGLMNTTADMFENVYVLSATKKIGGRTQAPPNVRYAYYAENEANPPVGDYIKALQGVYRYDDFVSMDGTGDYSTFNNCWDTDTFGVPVWRTKLTGDNYTPKIELLEITAGVNQQIQFSHTLDFASHVVVDNIYFYDAVVSYTLSDESIGSVSAEGVFTPLKTGTTDVTVTAAWRGKTNNELSVTVTVQVLDDAEISAPSSLTLYTADEVDGQSFAKSDTIMATIKINGQVVTPVLTILSGEDVISLDGNVVTALTAGEAVIEVSHTTANDEKYAETIAVTVERPFVSKDYNINFDLQTGKLAGKDIAALFGNSETVIVQAEGAAEGLTATVNEGAISFEKDGSALKYTGTTERVRIFTDAYGYECDMVAYDKVLNTAQDVLLAFNQKIDGNDNAAQIKSGYILLNNNIDATGITVVRGPGSQVQFAGGTLDGNEYAISNLTISGGGLLGKIPNQVDVVIKDIALKNLSFAADVASAAFISEVPSYGSVAIENVYVQIVNVPHTGSGGLASSAAQNTITYKNIIIEYPHVAFSNTSASGVIAAGMMNTHDEMFENVYAITTTKKMGGFTRAANDRYLHYAENEENIPVADYFIQLQGLCRYDTSAAMLADDTRDYSTFNSCWDTASGIPVWKN